MGKTGVGGGSRRRWAGMVLILALLFVGVVVLGIVGIRRQFFLDRVLITAIKQHDAVAVAAALGQGADPNARDTSELSASTGSILRYRLVGGHQAAASQQAALLFAIDLKARNGAGEESTIAKALLDHGAAVDSRDKDGNTLLHLAATFDHIPLVQLLLERGATVDARDSRGATPLFESSPRAAELLMAHHADINAKNHNSQTPLMWAVIEETDANVKSLLQHGADVSIRDRSGKTALDYAVEHGNRGYVHLLTLADDHGKSGSSEAHLNR